MNGNASSYYRVYSIADALSKSGLTVGVLKNSDLSSFLSGAIETKAIVAHRCEYRTSFALNEYAKQNNVKFGFDVDDYVFNVDYIPNISGVYELTDQDIKSYTLGVEGYHWAIKNADFVTVSSSNLVELVKPINPNAHLIPNLIDSVLLKEAQAQKLKRKPSSNVGKVLGYLSGSLTHQQDFQTFRDLVTDHLEKSSDNKLFIFGQFRVSDCDYLDEYISQVELFESVEFGKHFEYYNKIDLSIAPLEEENDFSKSKSWIKALDSISCGVPIICSDIPAYKQLSTKFNSCQIHRPGNTVEATLASINKDKMDDEAFSFEGIRNVLSSRHGKRCFEKL